MNWIRALLDRKSTRLNSSHTVIYTLSLHDALPISSCSVALTRFISSSLLVSSSNSRRVFKVDELDSSASRSEEHTSELQSHRDLHSFPTRRSSDLFLFCGVNQIYFKFLAGFEQ